MNFSHKCLAIVLCFALLLCGCTADKPGGGDGTRETEKQNSTGDETQSGSAIVVPDNVDFAESDADMFTDRDLDGSYSDKNCIQIKLEGDSVSCSSDSVKISGTEITLTKEAIYCFSGTLNNGSIVVSAGEKDKLQIVLNGASITSADAAPLCILTADKVFVTLADGTENSLTGGDSYAAVGDINVDGAVFSKQDLTFNGTGKLTVSSAAGHGIVCKDDLIFTGGTYEIQSSGHGLDANDSVRIVNASIRVDAGKDGIHSENSDDGAKGFVYISGGKVDIESEGDGISAVAYAQIEGGEIKILAGGGSENGDKANSGGYGDFMGGGMGGMGGMGGRPGGRTTTQTTAETTDATSMKGIKAEGHLLINNGTIQIDSADDTLHANATVAINGGTITLKSGDDGVHADEKLSITGCTMEITECYEGLEAEQIYVSGGNIKLKASDDGLNAAGGTDASGTGGRDEMFGGIGGPGGMGGMDRPGGMGGMSSSSNGYIEISGGSLYINASGDGIDANGSFLISGGYTVVVGPTTGDTATLDYDKEGKITGGTFIGTGAMGMAQTFSSAEQGVIALRVGNQTANTEFTLLDAQGKELFSYKPELSYAVVILSCPEMVKGQSYTFQIGEISQSFEAS